MPDPREHDEKESTTDRPELSQGRATPGDPALARSEKEEIDRYVEWQHDPETESVRGPR